MFTGVEAIDLGLADKLYSVKEHSIREAIGVSYKFFTENIILIFILNLLEREG